MNKFYDKLLLVIALLLLGGSAYIYLQKSGASPSRVAASDVAPANNPYKAIQVPVSDNVDASWPEPLAQSAGDDWLYDIFTPPKIYINKDGEFIPEPPKPPPPPIPFGVYLSSLERNLYRIQVEGYVEEDLKDASKSLVFFYDEELDQRVKARVGGEFPDSEFKLLEFIIERKREEGLIEKIAIATILDQRSGEKVRLTEGERLYDDSVTVVLRSEQNPSVKLEFTEAPQEFETPMGQYILHEINLEDRAVKVEKQGVDGEESEILILPLREKIETLSPVADPEIIAEPSESIEETFDFTF